MSSDTENDRNEASAAERMVSVCLDSGQEKDEWAEHAEEYFDGSGKQGGISRMVRTYVRQGIHRRESDGAVIAPDAGELEAAQERIQRLKEEKQELQEKLEDQEPSIHDVTELGELCFHIQRLLEQPHTISEIVIALRDIGINSDDFPQLEDSVTVNPPGKEEMEVSQYPAFESVVTKLVMDMAEEGPLEVCSREPLRFQVSR